MESISMDLVINLADEITFLDYSTQPNLLNEFISQNNAKSIFIDEIQRLPKLLNTIQTIIDQDKNKKIKFYLTGSSPRKLKRERANLLPGRLVNFYLGPFISSEFDYQMNTRKILEFGALPEMYLSNDEMEKKRVLKSYAANYIKEEIKAEALVRNLDSFARFFSECIKHIGQFIDHTKLAKHSKISRHAIPRYFEILEDTLVGKRIFPLKEDYQSLDLIKHPKFYFFDNGVYNGILGNFTASSDRIGALSEQLVFTQILHSAWARELDITISSFRTRSGTEVDFIVEIEKAIPEAILNGSATARLPNNVNFSFPNKEAEFLALQLDAAGIAVATKSACLKNERESYVIKALGGDSRRATSSIRFSFGKDTKKSDLEYTIKVLKNARHFRTKIF